MHRIDGNEHPIQRIQGIKLIRSTTWTHHWRHCESAELTARSGTKLACFGRSNEQFAQFVMVGVRNGKALEALGFVAICCRRSLIRSGLQAFEISLDPLDHTLISETRRRSRFSNLIKRRSLKTWETSENSNKAHHMISHDHLALCKQKGPEN